MGGTLQEEREKNRGRLPGPLGLGSLLSSQSVPCPPKPHPSYVGPAGHRREAGEIRRGRREGPSRMEGAGEERRAYALPTRARGPAGLPGEVPPTLRQGVGGTPEPLLFLEPKPHPPRPPGPFPALWVLSIGPAHHPNLALA